MVSELFLGVNFMLNRSKSEPLSKTTAIILKMAISKWRPLWIWKIHSIKEKNDRAIFNSSNSLYKSGQYQQKFWNRSLDWKCEIQNGRQVNIAYLYRLNSQFL